jgi:hypothetical protein
MYLFLDIDGVLHPATTTSAADWRHLPALEAVLQQHPHTEVIISSTWRQTLSLNKLRSRFSLTLRTRIIDCTPVLVDFQAYHREQEIRSWLASHANPDRPWVAIDDNAEWFSPELPELLLCNGETGLRPHDLLRLSTALQTGRLP